VASSHVQKLQSVVVVTDELLVVVDPGYFADEVEHIQQFAKRFEDGQRQRYLVLTHSDFDHIVGAHAFPGYTVLAASTWDEVNEQRAIEQIQRFDSEFYADRPWSGAMRRVVIQQFVDDGDRLGQLTFYHASGHTADGLVTVVNRVAIVGDYLSAVEFPFIYTSYVAYQNTLSHIRDVLKADDIDCVVTQHGPSADTPAEIERRLTLSEDYILRIDQLVQRGIRERLLVDEIVRNGAHFQYDGAPIPVGIQRFHENNIRLVFQQQIESA